MIKIVQDDPAVDTVNGFTGGGGGGGVHHQHGAHFYLPETAGRAKDQRGSTSLRGCGPKLAQVPGATLYLQASQDIRVGGRQSSALYQFTMRGDNLQDLTAYGPRMLQALRNVPVIADVNTDQQNNGLQSVVQYDRATAARFGISPQLIDNTLYDCLRPAPGLDHVYRAQSVSRRHGSGAAVLAESAVFARDLCHVRRAGSKFR